MTTKQLSELLIKHYKISPINAIRTAGYLLLTMSEDQIVGYLNKDEILAEVEQISFQDIQWVVELLNDLFDQRELNFNEYSNLVDSVIFGDK